MGQYKDGNAVADAIKAGPRDPFTGARPYKVADVLRSSGRAVKSSSFKYFDDAIPYLMDQAAGLAVLSDILLITAGEMYGDRDPLFTGEDAPEWTAEWTADRKFVTVLFAANSLMDPLMIEGDGLTENYPAAVYVADFSGDSSKDSAKARLAATLAHEYTHAAMLRIYWNASQPWSDPDEGPSGKERRYQLQLAFTAIKEATDDRLAKVKNEKLRAALKAHSGLWASCKSEQRFSESVPYLVEALFEEHQYNEPGAVRAVFGDTIVDIFNSYVVPDITAAAKKIRAVGAVT